jgi:glycosyltransferase involved in cell wall biosynthesis
LRGETQHHESFVERGGVRIHYLPARVLYPHFSAVHVHGLRAWLRQHLERFDVVHVHFAREYLAVTCAAAARAAGKPHVLQTHGTLHNRRWIHRLFDAAFTRAALRGASAVLHLQEEEARQLRAIEPRVKLEPLPNGIAMPDEPPTWSVARLHQEPTIAFIGTLAPVKRVLDLVDAVHLLAQRGLQTRCEIIGPDGGELSRARSRARELEISERIHFAGALPRAEAMRHLAEAAIYVQPSAWESFSLTTFEAMARGVPCVVTSASEFATRLREAAAAAVVDPGADRIAGAVEQILRQPVETAAFASRGRDWTAASFSLENVVDRLTAIYRTIAG